MAKRRGSALTVLLGGGIAVCVVLAAFPAAVGWMAGQYYAPDSPMASALKRAGWQYELLEQSPGWFSSTYRYRASIGAGESVQFRLESVDTMTHGPVVLSMLSTGQSPLAMAKIESQFDFTLMEEGKQAFKTPTATARTTVDYDRRCAVDVVIPATQVKANDTNPVAWSMDKASGSFVGSCDNFAGESKLDVPVVYVAFEGATIRVDNITLSSKLAMDKFDLLIGDTAVDLRRFVAHDQQKGTMLTFDGYKITTSTQLDAEDLYRSGAVFSVGAMQVAGQVFNHVKFDMELRRLDAAGFKAFHDRMTTMFEHVGTAPASPEEDLDALKKLGSAMLAKHPQFEIKEFSMDTSHGKVQANALIETDDIDPSMLENPMMLAQGVRVTAHAQAAQSTVRGILKSIHAQMAQLGKTDSTPALAPAELDALAGQRADEQLNFVTAMGIVKSDGADYISDVKYEKGQLTVNGQPFGLGPGSATPQ